MSKAKRPESGTPPLAPDSRPVTGDAAGSIERLLERFADGAEAAGAAEPAPAADVPWFEGTVNLLVSEGEAPASAGGVAVSAPPRPPPPVSAPSLPQTPSPRPVTPGNQRPWLIPGDEIACGGMSLIRRVVDQNLSRTAAVKVLRAELGAKAAARQRFVEEAQITAQLDHPNIPPIYDLWLDAQGNPCFAMKLVRGRTLKQMIAEHPPPVRTERQLEQLLQIFIKVCDAVSFAHSRGVIHRDLKPENVMVGTHGQVYVMDWGCALLRRMAPDEDGVVVDRDRRTQSLDTPGCAIGSCAYMAPEQARARPQEIDERTDVYLLGGTLYEILTAQPPHPGTSQVDSLRLAQSGEVPDPLTAAGGTKVPPGLGRIAMRALAAERSRRHQSVEELKEDVEQSLRHGWWFATVTFRAGSLVVREGDKGDVAYIITRGTCEAFRETGGERTVLRRMGPGEAFGETAILTGRPRSASVAAVDDVVAIAVTRDELERAVGTDSWVGAFVRALAERFREVDARLAQLHGGGVE